MLAWDITRWRRIFKISDGDAERKTKSRNPTSSKPQQKRARVQLFRDSYTAKWPYIVPSECDDYAFSKVCDGSFSIGLQMAVPVRRLRWNDVGHGDITELNKL